MTDQKKLSFEAEEITQEELKDSDLGDVSGGTRCDSCDPGTAGCGACNAGCDSLAQL